MLGLSTAVRGLGRMDEAMQINLAANKIMTNALMKLDPKMAAQLEQMNKSAESMYSQAKALQNSIKQIK